MKKVAILLALIFTVSAGFSQQRKRTARVADNMTAEQRTTLAVKKLTLALDLDKSQAKKIQSLYSKMGKVRMEKGKKMRKEGMVKREKMMKIKKASKDGADYKKRIGVAIKKGELKREDLGRRRAKVIDFDTANKALDTRIDFQNKMKKILNPSQYASFKKFQKRKGPKSQKRRKVMKTKKTMKKGKMQKRAKRLH